MTSISDLFSIFDSNPKHISMSKNKTGTYDDMIALDQGNQFYKYQHKIAKHLEKDEKFYELFEEDGERQGRQGRQGKEGFQGNTPTNSYTKETNQVLTETNISPDQKYIDNLHKKYGRALHNYENESAKLTGSATDYFDRISPQNPYLGKNIVFSDGYWAYVTHQGVVKLYENSNASAFETSTMFANTVGKNGCPGPNEKVTVNIPWGNGYSQGAHIPTKPPLVAGTPMVQGQSCGNEGTNVFVNQVLNNPSANYEMCAADNPSSPLMSLISSSSNYAECQQAAVDGGFQYFALQDVNTNTSTGICSVSNDLSQATSLGPSTVPTGQTSLWRSSTSGTGNTATLTNTGSLSVINSAGKTIYSTPNTNAQPPNYLGCYADNGTGQDTNRAMFVAIQSQTSNLEQCQEVANDFRADYFGLQYQGSGGAQCTISLGSGNNLSQVTEYGLSSNCWSQNGYITAGANTNAVYSANTDTSNYYLIMGDDGNVFIYRGTGPQDNQGLIWSTGTSNQTQAANPSYAASKGKYGQNWIPNGATLAAGDFVGNTNGTVALIMQSDGNLVLYTFLEVSNCQRMSDGNTGGGVGANAIYNLGEKGNPSIMKDLAYIDPNSMIHPYSSNTQYKNSYTMFPNLNSSGNDIPNLAYSNATVEQCQKTCNAEPMCSGFVFDNSTATCYPKTSGAYPNGASQINQNVNFYMRNAEPANPPSGVSFTTNNTDSITYGNYVAGGELENEYGLAPSISSQQGKLQQLQQNLQNVSQQMISSNNSLRQDNHKAIDQSLKNIKGINQYNNDFFKTKSKINHLTKNNMNHLVEDSDITVLQQNYTYLFWSILATGCIIVTMNVSK